MVALPERGPQARHRASEHVLRSEEWQRRLVLAEDAVLAWLPRVRRLLPLLHEVTTVECSAGSADTASVSLDLLLRGRL